MTFITGAIDKGGPATLALIFAILYWQEKSERKEMTKLNMEMTPRLLTALNFIQSILGQGTTPPTNGAARPQEWQKGNGGGK